MAQAYQTNQDRLEAILGDLDPAQLRIALEATPAERKVILAGVIQQAIQAAATSNTTVLDAINNQIDDASSVRLRKYMARIANYEPRFLTADDTAHVLGAVLVARLGEAKAAELVRSIANTLCVALTPALLELELVPCAEVLPFVRG